MRIRTLARGSAFVAALALGASLTSVASGADIAVQQAQGVVGNGSVHVMGVRGAPGSGQPFGVQPRAGVTALAGTNGIDYHGGPIVPVERVVNVYWAASTIYAGGPAPGTSGTGAQDGSLIGFFLRNLGGSPYYNTNTTYYDTVGGGHTVQNAISYTGFWADGGGAPTGTQNISDAAVINEIVKGLNGGQLAYDASTVYAVYSAGGVNLGGGAFTQYCAYHGYFSWNGHVVLYAVMPYNYYSPGSCSALSGSPNGDFAADAEVNTLTHELEEANTDPQLNAWYDSAGNENADKCAWNFGSTYAAANGATANIKVGGRDFLVQQQWLNANGGLCVKSYSSTPATVPGAPTLNSATATTGSISLAWSAPASNGGAAITNYRVYRGTTSGGESLLTTLGNVTSYTNTGLGANATYYYKVSAVNSVGEGAASNERWATTPAVVGGVPGAPTLTASTAGFFQRGVRLSWTTPANNGSPITGYRVYRSTSSGAETFLTTRPAGSTSWTDSSTSRGTRYYYRISAVNAIGEGPRSNESSAQAR